MQTSSKPEHPGERRLFVDSETLFTLQVPAGWPVDTSGQQGTKVILFHPRTDASFRPNINVTVQNIKGLTAEEFLTLTRLQFKQLSGGAALDLDEPASRPLGAHVLEWRMPFGPLSLKIRQLIVVEDGKAFTVSATAPAESFSSYLPDFQAILESFATGEGGIAQS